MKQVDLIDRVISRDLVFDMIMEEDSDQNNKPKFDTRKKSTSFTNAQRQATNPSRITTFKEHENLVDSEEDGLENDIDTPNNNNKGKLNFNEASYTY